MQIKKKDKTKIFFLLAFTLFLLPTVSALEITNTTFHSSVSNYTIHVDHAFLDQVNVTNLTISFYNVTSEHTNLTNTNTTYDARADFYGLDIGLVIRNINTSTDLFISSSGNQDYNATFTPLQVLRIMGEAEEAAVCGLFQRSLLNLVLGLIALVILAITISLVTYSNDADVGSLKGIINAFIAVVIGIIFLQIIASLIRGYCGG